MSIYFYPASPNEPIIGCFDKNLKKIFKNPQKLAVKPLKIFDHGQLRDPLFRIPAWAPLLLRLMMVNYYHVMVKKYILGALYRGIVLMYGRFEGFQDNAKCSGG